MRAPTTIVAAVLIALPASARADPPSNAASAPSDAPAAPDPILALYPPAALSAGVAGKATLKCGSTEHGGLTGCEPVSEEPTGQGFGEAALALAVKSVERPVTLPPDQREPWNITFTFKPFAPWITPDVLKPGWIISHPHWVRLPNGNYVISLFPQRAEKAHVGGRTLMICMVTASGDLTDCQIGEETPPGYGFGEAALATSGMFRMAPLSSDGVPVAGGVIRIPMRWDPTPHY